MSGSFVARTSARLRQQVVWAWRTLSPFSATRYLWWKLRHRLGERLPLFGFRNPPKLVPLRLKQRFGGGELWVPLTSVSLYTLNQVWVSRLYCGAVTVTHKNHC